MSIASMIDAKLVNEWPDARKATGFERALGLRSLVERPKSAETATPQATAVPATAIGQLARWIPTESITLYVAFLGVLNPISGGVARACDAGYTARWVALTVFRGRRRPGAAQRGASRSPSRSSCSSTWRRCGGRRSRSAGPSSR